MKMMMSLPAMMIAGAACAEDLAGFAEMTLDVPHHGRTVQGAYWYPAVGGGAEVLYGDNPVFVGTSVLEDADIAEGQFPVVLMSHGLGGNIRTLSWLTAGLAAKGAVVVSLNHPNCSTGDFELRAGLDHWTRVLDLQVAIDALEVDPRFSGRLDMSRVMAAGFSYGGWTALSMGGLTGDLMGYADHCAEHGSASIHCTDIARGGVDLATLDENLWNAAYADAGISMVAAIDPALHWGLDAENAAGLVDNVQVIVLGGEADRLFATDIFASGFDAYLTDAEITEIVPANHFSALLPCKPAGPAILAEEGEPPICNDPNGALRADIHARIIGQIAKQLGL